MPNHVTNLLNAKDIAVLPIFTEDENGDKELDFNKIIPIPEELLNVNSGGDKDPISCYLTKVQDVEDMKVVKNYYGNHPVLKLFPAPHILTDEELADILDKDKRTFDELVNDGKIYVDNLKKYGHMSWYEWRCDHWGTKWGAYDCQVFEPDDIEFYTAWSPAEPIVKKLSEQYPNKRFHLLYSDEFIGQFAGECVYENGERIEEIYAEGLDHKDMPELLYKIFGFTVKECVYIDKDGNIVKKTCEDCQCYNQCDRIR